MVWDRTQSQGYNVDQFTRYILLRVIKGLDPKKSWQILYRTVSVC